MLPDLMLIKGTDEDEINLAVGEASFCRTLLIEVLNEYNFELPINSLSSLASYSYPHPKGQNKLLELLKKKHNTNNIVITAGAKNGLSAVFYALKSFGSTSIFTPTPFWVSFPTLINNQNLTFNTIYDKVNDDILLVSPNNPDGKLYTNKEINEFNLNTKQNDKNLILDAAYHSPQYVSENYKLKDIGNIQIYSYSKKYGLSGLRVGYIVCNSEAIAKKVEEFLEITTSGVSLISQNIMASIEEFFLNNTEAENKYFDRCRDYLNYNRNLVKKLDKSIVDTSKIQKTGMFAFLPKNYKYEETVPFSKVKILDGTLFGKPNHVRISLGANSLTLEEAINRINETLDKT